MPVEGSSLGDPQSQRGHSQDGPYMASLSSQSDPAAQRALALLVVQPKLLGVVCPHAGLSDHLCNRQAQEHP